MTGSWVDGIDVQGLSWNLNLLASSVLVNSRRWFPGMHDPDTAVVPQHVQYALALAGEAGEVANVVKKGLRLCDDTPPEGLGDELADVFTYLLLLAHEAGVDLIAAITAKQAICEQRWG